MVFWTNIYSTCTRKNSIFCLFTFGCHRSVLKVDAQFFPQVQNNRKNEEKQHRQHCAGSVCVYWVNQKYDRTYERGRTKGGGEEEEEDDG